MDTKNSSFEEIKVEIESIGVKTNQNSSCLTLVEFRTCQRKFVSRTNYGKISNWYNHGTVHDFLEKYGRDVSKIEKENIKKQLSLKHTEKKLLNQYFKISKLENVEDFLDYQLMIKDELDFMEKF